MPPDNEDFDEVLKMVAVLLCDGEMSSSDLADQTVAEDEKDPGKESQGQTKSHEHLTLEALPNEIISSIAGMLAICIDEPYEVSRPYLTTSADRKETDAFVRGDLTSLCMVSKRMASNAQKALYRNVLVTNANTLILLYRSFLENPKLGTYAKRISLNIDHGGFTVSPWDDSEDDLRIFNGTPIDLSPLLCCAQHGLGEQFPKVVQDSRRALRKIPAEILFTLQFRVLSHTSNLESLDVNVHPYLPLIRKYTKQKMRKRHWEEVGAVLCSLWEEVWPCLPRVKELQMIGTHEPLAREGDLIARELFSRQICRCFLRLPNIEQLVWVNYSEYWFDTLPFLVVSGISTESRFESVRVLELQESPCLPDDLNTICSAFPNLESLSVDNGCGHKYFEPRRPYHVHANVDSYPGTGDRCLSDSLTALQNLTYLKLDLHYHHEVSGTFGPSGTLNLAGLPNLETLEMPFHFFAKSMSPGGYHQVASPRSILPRSLEYLGIMACYACDKFNSARFVLADARHRYWPPPWDHGDAVVGLFGLLADAHDDYFPSLETVWYEEVKLDKREYDSCQDCGRVVHHKSGNSDGSDFRKADLLLERKGVRLIDSSDLFYCLQPVRYSRRSLGTTPATTVTPIVGA